MGEWTVDTDSGYCWWVCWGVDGNECRTGEFEVVLNFGMAKLRTQLRGYTGYDQRPSIFDFG